MLKLELHLYEDKGDWRVYGPDGHYTTAAHIDKLPEAIRAAVRCYATALATLVAPGPDGGADI